MSERIKKAKSGFICDGILPDATVPFRMLHDECLVRVEKPERLTASKLLIIPDSAKREDYELYQGTVLAAGPGRKRSKDGALNPNEVKAGDRILFFWAAGEMSPIRYYAGSEELRIIGEWQIQALLESDDAE